MLFFSFFIQLKWSFAFWLIKESILLQPFILFIFYNIFLNLSIAAPYNILGTPIFNSKDFIIQFTTLWHYILCRLDPNIKDLYDYLLHINIFILSLFQLKKSLTYRQSILCGSYIVVVGRPLLNWYLHLPLFDSIFFQTSSLFCWSFSSVLD